MKKRILMTICCVLLFSAGSYAEEALNFKTVLPSPKGIFGYMRLIPVAGNSFQCTSTNEGLLFYNDDINEIVICGENQTADPLGGFWRHTDDALGDKIFLTDSDNYVNVRLGIGTENPVMQFHVLDEAGTAPPYSGLFSTGAFNGSVPLPAEAEGPGARLLWWPEKAAFRAGVVDGNQWDDTNIGLYSVAFGHNTIASGDASFATGSGSQALGHGSVAMGLNALSELEGGIALGTDATLQDNITGVKIGGVAAGYDGTQALRSHALALGTGVTSHWIAIGQNAQSLGKFSVAIGENAIAVEDNTPDYEAKVAIGKNARVKNAGIAIGTNAQARYETTPKTSIAIGHEVYTDVSNTHAIAIGAPVIDQSGNVHRTHAEHLQGLALGFNAESDGNSVYTMALGKDINANCGHCVVMDLDNDPSDIPSVTQTSLFVVLDGRVGIDTLTPQAHLHLKADGERNGSIITFKDVQSEKFNIDEGSTLYFGHGFRAGYQEGVRWDWGWPVGNVGGFSTVFGYDSRAPGGQAFAAGDSNTVLGTYGVSLGQNNEANGEHSFALGHSSRAAANHSYALGDDIEANQNYSVGVSIGDPAGAQVTQANSLVIASGAANNGRVGIGTSAPSYKLDVAGDINTTGSYLVNGACFRGACCSDIRLKENIRPLNDSLTKLAKLQPVQFEYKNKNRAENPHYGLIAQDTEQVFPEWVSENDVGEKQIHYGLQIDMHLIEAVKEMKELYRPKIDQIKKENAELKQLVEDMEKRLGGSL